MIAVQMITPMVTPLIRLQFEKCLQTVQDHDDTLTTHTQAVPQAPPQNTHPSKYTTTTTMKETHNDPPPLYKYDDTLQLSFLTTHYANAKDYIDEFPLYTVPQYITRKKHPSHDNYLYRRWNNPAAHKHTTKKTHTKHQRLIVTTKDDSSVTPTIETRSTTDTSTRHNNANINTDAILSIMIWNKPIVQYRMPIRPLASDRNQSRPISTAVRYALIGVYDKLLHPQKLPFLLLFFTSIICVVLSRFILLADSFTMVKIDDRYPDK